MKWLNLILATISATFHHNGWSKRAVSRVRSFLPCLLLLPCSLTHSDLPGIIPSELLVLLDNNLNTQSGVVSSLSVVLFDWATPLMSTMKRGSRFPSIPRHLRHRIGVSADETQLIRFPPYTFLAPRVFYCVSCYCRPVLCGNGSLIISFHSYANFNYDRVSEQKEACDFLSCSRDAKRRHQSSVISFRLLAVSL